MDYLLDSDVVIDFLKKKGPGFSFVKDLINDDLHMSIVSWSEIVYGINKSDNSKERLIEFEQLLKVLRVTIISVDLAIAKIFVLLKIDLERRGQRLADFDLLIASTTLVKDLTLVTGNMKHFSRIRNLKFYKS